MNITTNLAKQIITAAYEVVKNDMNLINESGIIIGSTDSKRIGDFHEAGYAAIHSKEPVIVTSNEEYKGTQKGINYPIFLDSQPIAAIGITGQPEELEQFGFLITKITEVFLKDQKLNEELLSKNRSLYYLISALKDNTFKNAEHLYALLEEYGIDPQDQFIVLSVRLLDSTAEQSLRYYFNSIGCKLSLYFYPNEWITIFDSKSYRNFKAKTFASQYAGKIHAGLGSWCTLHQISTSYQNAHFARSQAKSRQQTFLSLEYPTMDLILANLPRDISKTYADHILNKLSDKDLRLLHVYFEHDLSLAETAEALFIHKNTLQYQLDKIHSKCNLNPRKFQDAFLLKFALLCTF